MSFFKRFATQTPIDARVDGFCEQLRSEGFAHIKGCFPRQLIEETLAGVKSMFAQNAHIFSRHRDEDGHYPRIVNLHLLHKPLLSLFTSNKTALAVQDAFFGSPSSIYTSLYYERGSAQPIHRDTPYFCTRPEHRYLGVWVALEDADEDNGCLEVVRKGHLIPELDREAIALTLFSTLDDVPSNSDLLWNAYQTKLMNACRDGGLEVERVKVRAGDVVIWHPQLPHGGSKIQDLSRTRHSFVMHVTPVGTPVYHLDVFFNPQKTVPTHASWSYAKFAGRKYVAGDTIDIGHKEHRRIAEFVTS